MWVVHNIHNSLSLDSEVVTIFPVRTPVTVVIPLCVLCLGSRKIIKSYFQFQVSVKSLRGQSSATNLLLPRHFPWGFSPPTPTLFLAAANFSNNFSQLHVVCDPLGGSSSKFFKNLTFQVPFPCCIHDISAYEAPIGALYKC